MESVLKTKGNRIPREVDVIESYITYRNIYTANRIGIISTERMYELLKEHGKELEEKFPEMYKR